MNNLKLSMCCYMADSFLYKISDHSPIKFYSHKNYDGRPILSVEDGREKIVEKVNCKAPFMVGRYGTSEGRALVEYHQMQLGLRRDYSDIVRK